MPCSGTDRAGRLCRVAPGVPQPPAIRVHPGAPDRRRRPAGAACPQASTSSWSRRLRTWRSDTTGCRSGRSPPRRAFGMRWRMLELVGSAMGACSSWWGPPPPGPLEAVTLVLGPREGWPYSRLPLILLPGRSVITSKEMHTVLHETAHLWVADSTSVVQRRLAERGARRVCRQPAGTGPAAEGVQRGHDHGRSGRDRHPSRRRTRPCHHPGLTRQASEPLPAPSPGPHRPRAASWHRGARRGPARVADRPQRTTRSPRPPHSRCWNSTPARTTRPTSATPSPPRAGIPAARPGSPAQGHLTHVR